MIRVTIDPQESNDESADVGYKLAVWDTNGNLLLSSTTQAYSNPHDPIELAERLFGFGAGTSQDVSRAVAAGIPGDAMEPVELVIRWRTRPTETRRLR
jgi:hypothetical protein